MKQLFLLLLGTYFAIKGNETTAHAKTSAILVKTNSIPNTLFRKAPTKPEGLNIINKKYPDNTGGRTSGRDIKTSKIKFILLDLYLVIMRLNNMANGIFNKVA